MIRTATAAILALLLAAPAAADFLYGVTATDLVVIDHTDPSQVTVLGPHGLGTVAYLSYHPGLGRLFGLRFTDIGGGVIDYDLVEYDLCSGAGSLVRNLGDYVTVGAFEVLEYVASQAALVVSKSTPPSLDTTGFFTLDPDTGMLTPLVDVGFDNDFGVHDDLRNIFYAWDPNSDAQFKTVDLGGGGVTSLGATSADDRDGAFSDLDGGLFFYDRATSNLMNLETTNGVAPINRVPVGVVAGDEITGLAFTPIPPPVCGCAPLPGCIGAGKGSLAVVEKKLGAEKFKLALKKLSGATTAADFGNPIDGTTRYDVCLYDSAAELLAHLAVDRAGEQCGTKPCWKAASDKGFAYKDKEAESSGVKKINGRSGDAGKGKLLVQAGNKTQKGQDALPTGIAAALENTPSATVQVLVSDGACFEANLSDVKKADGMQFKGKGSGVSPQ